MLRRLINFLAGRAVRPPSPTDANSLVGEGDRLARGGALLAALARYRQALAADARCLNAHLGMGNVMVDLWMLEDAVAAYGRALALAPKSAALRSALLFHRHYLEPVDAQALFAAHAEAGAMLSAAAGPDDPLPVRSTQGRKIRIGYVSPNFSRHSVGYFIEPVIRNHDRSRFEIFCYYAHARADDATARFRAMSDGWHDVPDADGSELAAMVRADRIDVLVDLAGHSKANKLEAFALKPAPVQVTWLGYPDTTGLPAMDIRLTDAIADPAPQAEALNSEKLVRIEGSFLCYQPPVDSPPPGAHIHPPSAIVFGSFNNIAKISAGTVRACPVRGWC